MDITKIYAALDQYRIYHENVHGPNLADPVATIWNTISKVVLDFPFDFMKWQAFFLDCITNLLNISQGLKGLQHDLLLQSRNIFLGFVGGTQGKIALASGAGMLLTLMVFYLIYQYINGKGKFMHAVLHLLGVVMTMFCFFGNFTYTAQDGQRKTDMGGQILFDTVSNISSTVQQKINAGLMGYSGDGEKGTTFIESYVVKPAANFINTGNPAGIIEYDNRGKPVYFDYNAANEEGKKGQDYVDGVSKKAVFLKNDGKHLGQQMIGGILCSLNLVVYAIPLIVINVAISVISLFLSLLIALIPVSALLSFVPWFRNAFYSVVRYCLGLVVAPSVISAFAGVLFYLMMRIDFLVVALVSGHPTTNLGAALTTLSAPFFLMAMPMIILLKIVFIWAVWKSRTSLVKEVTGGQTSAFDGHALSHLQADWSNMQKKAQKLQGAAEVAAGATTGQPEVALDGASKVSASDAQASQQQEKPSTETPQVQENLEPEETESPEEENLEELPTEDLEGLSPEDEGEEENPEELHPEDLRDFISEDEENPEELHLEDGADFISKDEENSEDLQPEDGEDFISGDETQGNSQDLQETPVEEKEGQELSHDSVVQEALSEEKSTPEERIQQEKQAETQRAWQEAMEDLEEMRD